MKKLSILAASALIALCSCNNDKTEMTKEIQSTLDSLSAAYERISPRVI